MSVLPQLGEDTMESVRVMNVPTSIVLAAYLKELCSHSRSSMTDEEWIEEATDLLKALEARNAGSKRPPICW